MFAVHGLHQVKLPAFERGRKMFASDIRDAGLGHVLAVDADGRTPCQIDGGLKCFGHPIGASGLRMIYESYLQLQGRAGDRQLSNPKLGLNHNLGGFPHQNICSISIVGPYN